LSTCNKISLVEDRDDPAPTTIVWICPALLKFDKKTGPAALTVTPLSVTPPPLLIYAPTAPLPVVVMDPPVMLTEVLLLEPPLSSPYTATPCAPAPDVTMEEPFWSVACEPTPASHSTRTPSASAPLVTTRVLFRLIRLRFLDSAPNVPMVPLCASADVSSKPSVREICPPL